MPVRVRGHGDEENQRRRQAENPVGAVLPGETPAIEPDEPPREERRNEQDAPRRVKEVSGRDGEARRPESEEAVAGELRIAGGGLSRGGEDERRAEAHGVVGKKENERDQRSEPEPDGPRDAAPADRRADEQQSGDQGERIFGDRGPAGEQSGGPEQNAHPAAGSRLVALLDEIEREKNQRGRPCMRQSMPSEMYVKERRCVPPSTSLIGDP